MLWNLMKIKQYKKRQFFSYLHFYFAYQNYKWIDHLKIFKELVLYEMVW